MLQTCKFRASFLQFVATYPQPVDKMCKIVSKIKVKSVDNSVIHYYALQRINIKIPRLFRLKIAGTLINTHFSEDVKSGQICTLYKKSEFTPGGPTDYSDE